jgi:DNA-binding MarR family transcriptional regulator
MSEMTVPRRNAHLQASGLADQVGFGLRFAHAAVWGDLVATLEPFSLRPQHYAALLIITHSPGCRQQDIGEALGLFRSNLVALIDDLTGRGLVTRGVNADDRRSYALTLSEAGAALMPRVNAAHALHGERVATALRGYDPALLLEMLERLAATTPHAPPRGV